jgi:hypothetical protein
MKRKFFGTPARSKSTLSGLALAILVTICPIAYVRGLALGMLLGMCSTASVSGQAQTDSAKKAQVIADVQSLPAKPVTWITAEGAPIAIQLASAREIAQGTYLQFTGQSTAYSLMSTYPDVELLNTSGKTITSFMLIMKSKADKHLAITKSLSIAPGSAYTFESKRWLLEDKVTAQKDDGTFKTVMRKPGPDSVKFWLPGGASDLHVSVARVVFDDGGQWKWPEGFAW